MTDLATHLERLGLEQYLDAFVREGFDTWETLLDVQESDLETLNVKLGHRRKLQRAIADHRNVSYERLVVGSPTQEGWAEPARSAADGGQGPATSRESTAPAPTETKRRYRRHPKPDDNAPEKPPSAYVLFSNKVREEVKAENLSFTEIAKLVGDRWQKLAPTQKEPFESQAASMKEQYNIQLSAYRKTDSYKDYAQYLKDFKAKHGPQSEPKRPKLDPQSSGGSVSATSGDVVEGTAASSGHVRVGSLGSFTGTLQSPSAASTGQMPSIPNLAATGGRVFSAVHRQNSPPSQTNRERRLMPQVSSQSSTSDDSSQVPFDPLSRTATLSLSTPPANTPPLPSHTLLSARPEQPNTLMESLSWSSRTSQGPAQAGPITSSGQSSLAPGITLPSPTFSTDQWRERALDWTRTPQGPGPSSTGTTVPPLPLPPLLNPERMSDIGLGHVQRTLPPLRQEGSSGGNPASFSGHAPMAHMLSQRRPEDTVSRQTQSREGGSRPLDRSENEAANTLAGLAGRLSRETSQARDASQNR